MSIFWLAIIVMSMAIVIVLSVILVWYMIKRPDPEKADHAPPSGARVPVTLMYGEGVPERVRELFRQATRWWNAVLPGLFAREGEVGAGDPVPVVAAGRRKEDEVIDDVRWMELAWSRRADGVLLSVSVRINVPRVSPLSDAQIYRAAAHELGHVLGLAHDDVNENSVMHPTATGSVFGLGDGHRRALWGMHG